MRMRGVAHDHQFTKFLLISLISSLSISQHHSLNISRRRILHQPLFPLPVASPPPPPPSAALPPPPDQPFFLEQPNSPLLTQPPPPPTPSTAAATAAKTPQSKPTNGIAIAISVGTVTLGMISAFAFYLYKHRANKTLSENQSEKLVGEDTPAAAGDHTYLYVGTVNPAAAGGSVADVAMVNSSPYRKLNQVKRSDRYRPSPELQPMPPLPKQPFNSPLGRFSNFTFGFSPKRPKFAPPPPPPDTARLQSIVASKPPAPPPPPPLPRQVASKSTGSKSSVDLKETKREEMRATEGEGRIDDEDRDGSRPKLKPLHWDKVRATSGKATVWDQLKSSSFQLDEDKMETLFGNNSTNSAPKESTRKSVRPSIERENRILDPKKSQNIAILLRALNVTQDEVSEALLEGNPESMSVDLLETLVKMAPTKEEEIKLKEYKGDITKLGSAERFLRIVIDIPFAFKRVEAMLYRANFDTELKDLRKSLQTLEAASEELKTSRLFLKLIEAVLRTGNRMNVGTNRGDARAFKLDTLLKLTDVKGKDGKTTLLHFVIQEIIRSEGVRSDPTAEMNLKLKQDDFKKQGLKIVSGLCKELENVKKAANMDSDVLRSYVSKLETGLEKVKAVLQYEELNSKGRFFESMKMFVKGAGDDIARIKAHERKALSVVREVTEYFHGNMAKDEKRPLGIFVIVRDCLYTLENVCKEVGKISDNKVVGSTRSFRMPPTAFLPVVSRYNMRHESSSDDESSEP